MGKTRISTHRTAHILVTTVHRRHHWCQLLVSNATILQNLDVGHRRHLEQCTASRKRKQDNKTGHVEIEGLDELEAEEEARLAGSTEEEDEGGAKPAKVLFLHGCHGVQRLQAIVYQSCGQATYYTPTQL